jgi:hypothetical protein
MLRVVGPGVRLCDGRSRRALLQAGAVSALGLSLPQFFAARADAASPPPDVNCLLLWLWGAPSHVDSWDLKPEQPEEIRGPWRPIPTSAPGVRIVEHLPRFARQMHRIAQVRTMHNDAPDHPEGAAIALSGFRFVPGKPDKEGPHLGSVIARFARPASTLPQAVTLGRELWDNGARVPGQYGGFLGGAYAPFRVEDPRVAVDRLPSLRLPDDVSPLRFGRRETMRRLLDRFERRVETNGTRAYDGSVERALGLLTSPDARRAFDLSREPDALRDRYGRSFFGQSCLAARRLIEAGVRYVQVNWSRHPGADGLEGWDVHGNFGGILTDYPKKQYPNFDQAASALMTDMADRGLLENTLVIFATEFGRSPKINQWGGRDHWSSCYTIMFAGAGIEGGRVIGDSDATGAYPATEAYGPRNMLVTVYRRLGLDTTGALREAGLVDQDAPIPGLFGNAG